MLTDFYQIVEHSSEEHTIETCIRLNPESAVFTAHFPGKPILPGVLLIQLFKSAVERTYGTSVQIAEIPMMKFMATIVPDASKNVVLNIQLAEEAELKLIGKAYYEKELAAKVSLIFKKV